MPRPANAVPSYLLHKSSGQAIVKIRQADGSLKTHYLGVYGTPESRAEYGRLVGGHNPASQPDTSNPATVAPSGPITVAELIVRFMDHAERYYRRPDGTVTNEVNNFRHSLRALRFLYGHLPVTEFGPLCLKAVRTLLVSGYTHPDYGTLQPVSRNVVNHRVRRIRHVFKWGAAEELVPPIVYQSLQSVIALKAGRSDARETDAVEPVAWDVVEKTLPHLNPVVRAMVLLQWHTGCRPGEVCSIRADEIDRVGDVWFYRPSHHKLAYRGKPRVIAIGKSGQEVLLPFLDRAGILFSPTHAVELWLAEKRSNRKSKVQPSQQDRSKASPKKQPGEMYETSQYNRAIARACKAAGLETWHPNQLRHSFATRVRGAFGLEAAQVVLGHSNAAITQIYAERDLTLATRVAESIG